MVALGPSAFSSALSLSSCAVMSGTLTRTFSILAPSSSCCFPRASCCLPSSSCFLPSSSCGAQFAGAVDGGLVANDVRLLVDLEPDEVAGDAFAQFLDVAGVSGGTRHGEGVGLAGDDDEALVVVVAVSVGITVSV